MFSLSDIGTEEAVEFGCVGIAVIDLHVVAAVDLVVGAEAGSKADRARELGVAMMDEREFVKFLAGLE